MSFKNSMTQIPGPKFKFDYILASIPTWTTLPRKGRVIGLCSMLCSGLHTACTSWKFFSDLLLLHAKHSPFYMYWRINRKRNSSLVLKVITKKSAKQENLSLFMNIILWNGKMRVENQTKTRVWEDSSLCPETLTKNVVQEFHLWTQILTDSVGNFSLVYGCCGGSGFRYKYGYTTYRYKID